MRSLAVNTILQSSHINDIEGGMSASVAFDTLPQASLEEMMDKVWPHAKQKEINIKREKEKK